MSFTEQIQTEVTVAAKARDKDRLSALRMLLDALNKESKAQQKDLDEQEEIAVLKRERKRRAEAAEAFAKGGRDEAAAKEKAEVELIDVYLPAQMSDGDLRAIVEAAVSESGAEGMGDIGKVMSVAMPKIAGQADGKRVNEVARELLA